MQRLLKTTVLLLLLIWLPATLHCDLEAAGLTRSHPHDSCAAANDCKTDGCAAVESSLIRETAPVLNLIAPVASDCFLYLFSLADFTDEGLAEASLSRCRQDPPPEIEASWHFLTRAAPLSRAPALLPA